MRGRARSAGPAQLKWDGKVKGKPAAPGRYFLRVRALTEDGQLATATVAARLVRR